MSEKGGANLKRSVEKINRNQQEKIGPKPNLAISQGGADGARACNQQASKPAQTKQNRTGSIKNQDQFRHN
jgi:hypothetical protein